MPEYWLPYLTAFTVGLVGGVHCLGMCGGIIGALSFRLPGSHRPGRLFRYQLAYNLGRISSYTAAGALMGGLGVLLVGWLPVRTAQQVLLITAGITMLLLGLYLSGWWTVLRRVEQAGGVLWRRIEPHVRGLLPPRNLAQAYILGAAWGWLPCGLVYSMLIQAVSSGGALEGASLMLAFALGTLPNLLLLGMLAGAAARLLQTRWIKSAAGLLVVGFGFHALWRAFNL
ncbi:sulfite exporter TauE/SafE family protein [Motiliproteus sediminis]|uniref:sulfite exporter TauE/SafE family protein n=1 Tax=Motiliproteus sediminis TaxID=1468178 RepID=UPI001AEF8B0B|nr:sulfite exporter TauE/SafE family protein [Motiliproteus sediminis]